jgi:hypothetical protein
MNTKAVAVHRLDVMRRNSTAPNPVYSLGQVLVVAGVLFVGVLSILVAATNPVAVVGAVAAAALTALATTVTLDYRRKVGRTRELCVPNTGVCVEA